MLLVQILTEEPPSPRKLNSGVPRDLETITLKSLEKDSKRRYSTAFELAEELGRFVRQEPIAARPISKIERGWRWARRNRTVAALSALLLVILFTAAIVAPLVAIEQSILRSDAEKLAEEHSKALKRQQAATLELARQERVSTASRLVARAAAIMPQSPQTGLLLALESVDLARKHKDEVASESEQVLRDGLANLGGRPITDTAICASTPDGRWLVTGSELGVKVHRLTNGTLANLGQATGGRGLSFFPRPLFSYDGKRLVVATEKTIQMFDLSEVIERESSVNEAEVPKFQRLLRNTVFGRNLDRTNEVSEDLSMDEKGRWLAAGGATARLWDLRNWPTEFKRHELFGHDGPVNNVEMSSNGRWLATASSIDPTVRCWDLSQAIPQQTPRLIVANGKGFARLLSVPGGASFIAQDTDGTIRLIHPDKSDTVVVARPQLSTLSRVIAVAA
jgi:hypothetical protein